MRTLLLGMGNPILSDDAVGVRLASDLKRWLPPVPSMEVFEDCNVGGLNLLDVLAGYDRVIVLDSVRTSGGVPGAWYHFGLDSLKQTLHLTNIHDVNIATALALGYTLGIQIPDCSNVHVFAVEVDDTITFSETMTPALEDAYPRFAAAIRKEVEALVTPGPG